MSNSPGFSSFRELIDIWDKFVFNEDIENRVNTLIDSQDFIFFFKKEKQIFAATEEGRMIFAKLIEKNKDKEEPKAWKDEASFLATNLTKAIEGESIKSMFNKDNVKEIKIIDKEEAKKILIKQAKKEGVKDDTEIPIDKIILPTDKTDIDGLNNIIMADEE